MTQLQSIITALPKSAANVMRAVCLVCHVTPELALGTNRCHDISNARRLLFALTYERNPITKEEVTAIFGRPLQWINTSLRIHRELMKVNNDYRCLHEKISNLLDIDGFGDTVTTGVTL